MKNANRMIGMLVVVAVIAAVSVIVRRNRQPEPVEFPGPGVTAEELPPPVSPTAVRIALWNVRNFPLDSRPQDPDLGFSRRTNFADLEDALRGLDADVLGFEEITDPQTFSEILERAGGDRTYRLSFGTRGGPHDQFIALAWDENRIERVGEIEEIEGVAVTERFKPALVGTFRFRNDPTLEFTVIQVHLAAAPWGFRHRRGQYQALTTWIDAHSMGSERANVIVQGDFNVTGWEGGSYEEERDLLDGLMRGAGLRRSPNASGCTEYWEGGGERDGIQIPALLDLVYLKGFEGRNVSKPRSWLHCRRLGCKELKSIAGAEDGTFWDVSDHCPVTYEIGPGS